MASEPQDYQARVDDYHSDDSDDGHVLRGNFPRKASPTAQANVSTKRSKDLNTEQAPASEKMMPANIDLRSDSGYSSFTAASKSSADSGPSATSRSPPVLPPAPSPIVVSQSPAPKSRRPTVGGEQRQHSNDSSPRQRPVSISRTASVSSKQRPSAQRRPTVTQDPREKRDDDCTVPNCTTCGPNALPQGARRPRSELHSAATSVSQRSDPNPYYSPPSPTYHRQPAPYAQGAAVVIPARTRRPSTTTRRPSTIAGEMGPGYWVPGMPNPYPSPPQERGPPPSLSAYQNINNMQHMQNMQYPGQIPPYMGNAPQGNYYPQATQPYEPQHRPSLSARGSSGYGQRSHPPPIITQDDNGPNKYSARFGHGPPPTPNEQHMRGGANMPRPKLLQYTDNGDDQGSESESSEGEEDYEYDQREATRRSREAQNARVLMPPPKIKRNASQQRPPLTHAKTTQVTERLENNRREKRRQSVVVPDRVVHQERERERPTRPSASTRRDSVSRPPAHRHTQSEYDTRHARVVVNDSRSNRRQSSYQVYEKAYEDYVKARAVDDQYNAERKREKRASRVIEQDRFIPGQFEDDDDDEEEEVEAPPRVLTRPRRKTESDPRKGKERTSEVKNRRAENDAEAYIKSTRGSHDPFADQINKAALKKSRMPSEPSDSGSSRSHGSGNRTTMTSATNNEIRLRVDGTMPLSLQLTGDMDGRTLQLVPAENGMTDLVIGGGRGETTYRSERGSMSGTNPNINRRSLIGGQGRRELEDASERSSRSAPRSRRDRDEIREVRDERAPVLRRSRHTTYH